jgi:adenylate kinase family enzyme
MTIDTIHQLIITQMPAAIYIGGKTSTGKSTFSRRLHNDAGYQIIELEAILLDIVKAKGLDEPSTFRKVFYDSGESPEKTLFFDATDRIIAQALAYTQPLVIEGAVANGKTLKRILSRASKILFIFFHPHNLDVYVRNLTDRFMQSIEVPYGGLPLTFWQCIDDDAFKEFCKTRRLTNGLRNGIQQYAQFSQSDSLARINLLQTKFENILIVEI